MRNKKTQKTTKNHRKNEKIELFSDNIVHVFFSDFEKIFFNWRASSRTSVERERSFLAFRSKKDVPSPRMRNDIFLIGSKVRR